MASVRKVPLADFSMSVLVREIAGTLQPDWGGG